MSSAPESDSSSPGGTLGGGTCAVLEPEGEALGGTASKAASWKKGGEGGGLDCGSRW